MKSHLSQDAIRPSSQKQWKNNRINVQPLTSSEHVRQARKDRLDQEIFEHYLLGFGAGG